MMKLIFFLGCLYIIVGYVAGGFSPRPRIVKGGALRPPYLAIGTPVPEAQWIEQKLDHFSNGGSSTWKQRYFVNSTWWNVKSGPVFLLLGGEGPASPAWIVADTHIMLLAKKYSALVLSVEHRFYGESHPTRDASIANLAYLSSRQALADFAYFHDLMVDKYLLSKNNKWISFGGSYSGALSAWFRKLYPDVVVGAVASSAPVLAKEDFVEYVEVVALSLGNSSQGRSCPASVTSAFAAISDMLKDKARWSDVEKMFNVRHPMQSVLDVASLVENLAGVFEGVVQYNMDNTAFEGRLNNVTIDFLCDVMVDGSLGSPLQRFLTLYKTLTGNVSMDVSYASMIKIMMSSDWDSSAVLGGGRQWTYQTCTEFGYFQTTNAKSTPLFSSRWITLDYFSDMCLQIFNVTPTEIGAAVARTNGFYGGKDVNGTNIVFPNGSVDPWHALSITSDLSATQKALFIHGTAHCANMYPPKDDDPLELKLARQNISALIQQWLS